MDGYISDLQTLIKQPIVYLKKQGLNECAYLVASIMKRAGISTKVLDLDGDSHSDDNNKNGNKENHIASPAPPIIYGDSKKQQRLLSVLLYESITLKI
jgi:hypothetical protein